MYDTYLLLLYETGDSCRLNHAIVVKLYHAYTQFRRRVCLTHRRIAPFLAHRDFFIIAPYRYSYLLIYPLMSFLSINIYASSVGKHLQTAKHVM